MNVLELDPFVERSIARARLTPEDRAILGPLAKVEALNSNPENVQQALMEAAASDLFGKDPIRSMKAMGALRKAYELLTAEGFAFKPLLADMEARMDRRAKKILQRLTREYLGRGPQEEEAGRALCELIQSGRWTIEQFDQAVDEWAAEHRVKPMSE
jgi:hypothetical protein